MSKSLPEVSASVEIKGNVSFFRRLLTFSGPAFMVSVGYMDPGNWATDIAGGAKFGYSLIWVILLANLMAILFQTLSSRLGVVTGRDLAQACRDHYPKYISVALWIICEVAIAACDLAEVVGSAIGLYLLFHIPLLWGVVITTLDVLLLMTLLSFGIRKMEAFILVLISTIGLCFAFELFISKPVVSEVLTGFIPIPLSTGALFIALGIIGATIMPHNLYLHSALVQSRNIERTDAGIKQANKFNFLDSFFALNAAFFVNAAILIISAAFFFKNNITGVSSIIEAHKLLANIVGDSIAPAAFGIALLAAGQSSTITGTFAGQVVMEGFVGLRVRPWLRRLITRIFAVAPAAFVIYFYGNSSVDSLLVFSQVVLSLQLPFAIIPLLHFTSSTEKMGKFANSLLIKILAYGSAIFIASLNLKYVFDLISESIKNPQPDSWLIQFILFPISIVLTPFLFWVMVEPFFRKTRTKSLDKKNFILESSYLADSKNIKRVGIALEGNHNRDAQIIKLALPILRSFDAEVTLIHCVETAPTQFMGDQVADSETFSMEKYLLDIKLFLESNNLKVEWIIGGGEPEEEIVRIAREQDLEMLITGSHGHRFISDLIYGSTVDGVRHKARIPVLAFPIN